MVPLPKMTHLDLSQFFISVLHSKQVQIKIAKEEAYV